MFATMYAVDGIGLAANQIGVLLNVFVFDCPDRFGQWHRGYMINPTRTYVDDSSPEDSEGCLSIPGVYSEFPRSSHVVAKGTNLDNEPISVEGKGYFARCLLHETQHLEGTLFVDLLTGDTRKDAMKAIRDLDLRAGL
jgi:peptide deformylase